MTEASRIPLSVLDVAPVWRGSTATEALRNTLDLARRVERFGYRRYWMAEHHNTPSLATSVPGVMTAAVAGVTSTIRVGSGGVLLPNHAPFVVAEQFGTLEAIHPGRIDLGLGRAPGTDPLTARALHRTSSGDDFPERISELLGYFAGPDGSPSKSLINAVPAGEHRPQVWVLGSSPASGQLAGLLGLPYAYAHQIRPQLTAVSIGAYREHFRPSPDLRRPHSIVCAMVVAGEDDAKAHRLIGPMGLTYVLHRRGVPVGDPLPTQREADTFVYTTGDRELLDEYLGPQLIGGPETLAQKVPEFLAETGADELMALTGIPDHEARIRSYELLAQAVGLARDGVSVTG
ncbi:LLM class flavin-dependent oxidoreductase [Actinomadura syzygii]|uniref:LLM class flavin-dependent oxidoreductase n=1 Tax=Actinomadura syzygii TaxID=1427538 RepID=A0A5D0TY81_9ACTN|nr:LLM class flavin-dependent oxidoreductase [Actinomadura syzygii]TYC10305.1 LLM class flavin-dependent oxidoreductase [Actinomadura syzygii]